jgi:hypothetical protein
VADPDVFYLLVCRECGDGDLIMPFGSAEERGKWAGAHTSGTGHDRWWVQDRRPGELVTFEREDPEAAEMRLLAADLLELFTAGALAGIRAIVAERLRQVRGGDAVRVDGRAYQAAVLAAQIDREVAR